MQVGLDLCPRPADALRNQTAGHLAVLANDHGIGVHRCGDDFDGHGLGTGRERVRARRIGAIACARCDGEGLLRQTEEVRLGVPANAGDVTQIKVPLRGLGPHNFYLSVRIRVAGSVQKIKISQVGS